MAVLLALLAGLAWLPVRAARAEWRAGRNAESIVQAEKWKGVRLWPNQYRQMLAVSHLTAGNRSAAQRHLDGLRGKKLLISAVPKSEVAARLFAEGAHQDFLNYDATVSARFGSGDTPLYRAAALTALNRVPEAQAVLKQIDRNSGDSGPKVVALERAIAERQKGSFPYVLDREGQPLALFKVSDGDITAVSADFEALVEKEAGKLTIESQAGRMGVSDVIETTLDPVVQKAAMKALSGFRGALVAIDTRTHEIVAVASSRGDGPLLNLALEKQYEPGSVIKVITGLTAFENDVELKFPYKCDGFLPIDGRKFGDWLEGGHGTIPDFDVALARSCNVVFADLGVRLGADRLQDVMTKAGFDGRADLGVAVVPLGKTVGKVYNKFETGFYAIGIEHETSSTLHVAMLASMIANRGELTHPRLIRARRSILGEPVETPKAVAKRVVSAEVAERMVKAMVAVVNHERGTGRRAPIEGVSLAMKTGTAGKEADGYHAVIMAFAPAESPRIAFAIIAEKSGPAEFAGAKIAHDFLSGIAARLR